MRAARRRRRRLASAVLTFAVCLPGTAATASAEGPPGRPLWSRVYIDDSFAATAVRSALTRASRRLENGRCAALFSAPDLRDQGGRPLHEGFEALQTDAPRYLDLVVFVDGSEKRACQTEGVLAFTHPGSRVVYVCSRRFWRSWKDNPRSVETAVIHEALHTLGLGEDPPSSQAITRTVLSYCYR